MNNHKNCGGLGFNSLVIIKNDLVHKKSIQPKYLQQFLLSWIIGFTKREVIFYELNNGNKTYNKHYPKIIQINKQCFNYELIMERICKHELEDYKGISAEEFIDITTQYLDIRSSWISDGIKHPYITYSGFIKKPLKLLYQLIRGKKIIPSHGDFRAGNLYLDESVTIIDFQMFSDDYEFRDYMYLLITSINLEDEIPTEIITHLKDILSVTHDEVLFLMCVELLILKCEVSTFSGIGQTECVSGDYHKMELGVTKWINNIQLFENLLSDQIRKINSLTGFDYSLLKLDKHKVMNYIH